MIPNCPLLRAAAPALVALLAVGCASAPGDRADGLLRQAADAAIKAGAAKPIIDVRRVEAPVEAGGDSAAGANETRIFKGDGKVVRLPEDGAKPVRGDAVALRFEGAPIADVVHAVMGDMLKLNYTLHPPIAGEVTLHTLAPLPPDQILTVLESLLEANGLAIAQDSTGLYHIGRPDALRFLVPTPRRADSLPPGTSMVVVPLKYIGAGEMAEILRPVATPQALLRVDALRNLLVLAGTRNQLNGWLDMVEMFDVDLLKGMSVGLFPLKHTSVAEIQAALQMMTSGGGASASAPAAGATAPNVGATAAIPPISGALKVLPIERMNALLIVTPFAAYLDKAREWIEKLDRADNDGGARLFVYPVQNGSATQLANLLNGIFGGQVAGGQQRPRDSGVAPGLSGTSMSSGTVIAAGSSMAGQSGAGYGATLASQGARAGSRSGSARRASRSAGSVSQVVFDGDVRVVSDEERNALLIYAPRAEYERIEAALRQLDTAPSQVLIEASIVEVKLTDETRYGLQWFFTDNLKGRGWSGTGQLGGGSSGGIVTAQSGFSYTVTNPLGDVHAVLNLLASKELLNVISSPSVLVLDNQTAEIKVGDQQPVRNARTVTDGGTTTDSISYKDTGVLLTVTPSINAGNMITLDLEQQVTDVGEEDTVTGQRSFLQRQIASKISVPSGETVVLGGLIRDRRTKGRQGIPVLHDVPVLGNLFGSTGVTSDRTELLVMITPRVVRNDQDLKDVTVEIQDRMRSLKQSIEERSRPEPTMLERADPSAGWWRRRNAAPQAEE